MIDERSFGSDHPKVALRLNNLANLFYVTNRWAEAEPLMRRALTIVSEFTRRTGHEHPYLKAFSANYRGFLEDLGKSKAEIEETIEAL